MSARYFAFVRRDEARRYHATLPDFPGCAAEADGFETLSGRIRDAVFAHARSHGWPPPTRQEALPRQADDHDGFWLMVDLPAMR